MPRSGMSRSMHGMTMSRMAVGGMPRSGMTLGGKMMIIQQNLLCYPQQESDTSLSFLMNHQKGLAGKPNKLPMYPIKWGLSF